MKKSERNSIIKKDETLVKARSNLTLNQRRILLTLISMIRVDDVDFQTYRMTLEEFVNLGEGIQGNQYAYFKRTARELFGKTVMIGTKERSWIITADYKEGEAYIDFTLHPDLKPYLLNLKSKFLKYEINNVISLKSSYAQILYELLKHELELLKSRIGNKRIEKAPITFNVEELRYMISAPEKYRYNDIKRILHKCAKDMQTHSDISFRPITKDDEKKTGRRVTEITLNVYTVKKNNT